MCQLRDLGAETSNLVPAGLGAAAKAERVRLGPRQKPGPLSAANLNVMQPRIVGGTLPTFTVAASGPRLEAGARDQVVLRGASATPSSSLVVRSGGQGTVQVKALLSPRSGYLPPSRFHQPLSLSLISLSPKQAQPETHPVTQTNQTEPKTDHIPRCVARPARRL